MMRYAETSMMHDSFPLRDDGGYHEPVIYPGPHPDPSMVSRRCHPARERVVRRCNSDYIRDNASTVDARPEQASHANRDSRRSTGVERATACVRLRRVGSVLFFLFFFVFVLNFEFFSKRGWLAVSCTKFKRRCSDRVAGRFA